MPYVYPQAVQVVPGPDLSPVPIPEALPEDVKKVVENWQEILKAVRKRSAVLYNAMQSVHPTVQGDKLILVFDGEDRELHHGALEKEERKKELKAAIAEVVKKDILKFTLMDTMAYRL